MTINVHLVDDLNIPATITGVVDYTETGKYMIFKTEYDAYYYNHDQIICFKIQQSRIPGEKK